MKTKIYIALIILFLIPFTVNIFGKSIYLYVNVGEKDIILASALGLFHCAIADKMDFSKDSLLPVEGYGYESTEIINGKRVNLFLEPSQDMEVFTFRLIRNEDYFAFEVPILVFISIAIFMLVYKRKKSEIEQAPPETSNS